jgi:tol-pal system protein YbgF
VASRIQDLESEIQKLRDKLERLQSSGAEDKNVRDLTERVIQLEKQIGIQASKRAALEDFPNAAGSGSAGGKNTQRDDAIQPKSSQTGLDHSDDSGEIRGAAVGPDEKAYRQAYSTFKSGSLEQAVTQFEEYVKKNPKSQFVPSAIYWIGEARLEQGRFDEAVLQFDRVIKEYPGSKKELSALFKQGQAFEKMGDIKSAKIIFQKLVKDQPHSTQGRLAAARLKSLANSD